MCISVYKWESIVEIYSDAQTFGLKSVNSSAVSNSSLAISWLEATFPDISQETMDEGNLPTIRAHPHALFDSSLSLQVYVNFFVIYVNQNAAMLFLFSFPHLQETNTPFFF